MLSTFLRSKRLIAGVVAIVVGAGVLVTIFVAMRDEPFDPWYEDSAPQKAEWKLVIHFNVRGQSELPPFEAYYRRRSSPLFGDSEFFADPSRSIITEVMYGGTAWASFACGGGGGQSEFLSTYPSKTKQGLKIDVEYERRGSGIESAKINETMAVPFRTNVDREQGMLQYRATWTHLN